MSFMIDEDDVDEAGAILHRPFLSIRYPEIFDVTTRKSIEKAAL